MSFFLSTALAEAPAAATGTAQDPIIGLLLPIGLVLVLYVFMIRPQVKRQKEHKKMVEALAKGDEVVTVGGVLGRVTDLGDDFATLEVADDVQIKIRRAAVEAVLPKGTLKEI